MEKFIEIPEGYEARIDGSKIVLEPKESDDDRIRKDLVNFIRGALLCEFNRTEYLDWIEKHKEQKSVDYAEELKKCKDNSLYFFDKYVKIKLKPEDWSDEDEAAYCDLIWCIEQARKSAKDENDMGNIWFAEKWIKNRLKSIRPQQKYEWNEADEKALIQLIENGVTEAICKPGSKFHFEDEYAKELIEYIRAFNPAPHWRPSKLQMKALLSKLPVVKGGGDKIQDILESLYNELKKLM